MLLLKRRKTKQVCTIFEYDKRRLFEINKVLSSKDVGNLVGNICCKTYTRQNRLLKSRVSIYCIKSQQNILEKALYLLFTKKQRKNMFMAKSEFKVNYCFQQFYSNIFMFFLKICHKKTNSLSTTTQKDIKFRTIHLQ